MKQCPNCHNTYSDEHLFCIECGTPLVEAPPPPPPPEPAPPPRVTPPEVSEPTVVIPPSQPPQPPASPAAAPAPPAPHPKKKGMIPVGFIAIPTVVALLAIAAAGFIGFKALQFKTNCEEEQSLRIAAEKNASDIQAQLDKLQLDHNRTTSALDEANQQLEDTRSQLEEVSGQLTDGSSRLDEVEEELHDLISMLGGGYGFGSTDYYASKGVVVVSQYSSESIAIYESMVGETTFTYHTPGYGFSCKWDNDSFSNGRNSVTVTGDTPGYYTLSFSNNRNSDAFDILVIVTAY